MTEQEVLKELYGIEDADEYDYYWDQEAGEYIRIDDLSEEE
jgi:hypothetical protein